MLVFKNENIRISLYPAYKKKSPGKQNNRKQTLVSSSRHAGYRFPELPDTPVATNILLFLSDATKLLYLPDSQRQSQIIATAFQSVFSSYRMNALLLSLTDAQCAEIPSAVIDFLSGVQTAKQVDRFWVYYRSLAHIFIQCPVLRAQDLSQLLGYFYDQSPTDMHFASLLAYMIRDIATSRRPLLIKKLNAVMVSHFFDYGFTQQSWEAILLVFAHERQFDLFNHLYKDVTDKVVHSVTDFQYAQSKNGQSYRAFVDAILSVGIYHKGMPRDCYRYFLYSVVDCFKKNMAVGGVSPAIKRACFECSISLQFYMSHVLAQIVAASNDCSDEGAFDNVAFERCVQLLVKLRCVDVITVDNQDVSSAILGMLSWPSFVMPGGRRMAIMQFQCEAFLSESRETINGCGASTSVVPRFHQAWTVIYVGLIQHGTRLLLTIDGSDESLSSFIAYLEFCEDYFLNIRPLVVSERWIDYFEHMIEPKMLELTEGLTAKLSDASEDDRIRLHGLVNHFLKHVQAQMDLVLGGLKHVVSLRIANFVSCFHVMQSLDLQMSPHVIGSLAPTSDGVTLTHLSLLCETTANMVLADHQCNGTTGHEQSDNNDRSLLGNACGYAFFHPPPGLVPPSTITSSQSALPYPGK